MFGGVLGSLKIPVIADLKRFEEGIAKAEVQAKAGGAGIGNALKGGIGPAMIGAAAGIGIATVAIKSMIDISDAWEASQKGLKQATDSVGFSYVAAAHEANDFIQTNKKYVSSQAEVVDSYAALIRMGLSSAKAQEDLNLALDLATIKHVPLTTATLALQGAEMGRGKALIPLGIQMKEYPVLTETATQAAKKLADAQKAVQGAQLALTDAVKKHGPHSAQAKVAADHLATANADLAKAHNYVVDRAKASTEIHDLLHQKLDGGRKSTSDLQQASNNLGNSWQTFSQTHGPAFLKIFTTALEILGRVADAIGWVLQKSLDLQNALGHLPVIGGIQAAFAPVSGGKPAGAHHRQSGGEVARGQDYIVGETGTELLRMGSQSGRIIPHGAFGGGGGMVIHNHFEGAFILDGPTVDRLSNLVAQRLSYTTGR